MTEYQKKEIFSFCVHHYLKSGDWADAFKNWDCLCERLRKEVSPEEAYSWAHSVEPIICDVAEATWDFWKKHTPIK